MTTSTITEAINSHKYRFTCEVELQDGLELVFKKAKLAYIREAMLTDKDRIDFLIGNVGVEVKIGGSLADVTRQLHRYAQLSCIESLVLVTSKLRLSGLPDTINDKPLVVVSLMGSIF